MRKLKILVACEYSGTVRDAFTNLGHDAISCDLLASEFPGKHYQGNIFDIINDGFDLMIGHPPCTYLCRAQIFRLAKSPERTLKSLLALDFFLALYHAPIKYIALENPIGILSKAFRPPDQIIQPWQFGDIHRKDICLWLKNLPPLICTCYNTKRIPMQNHVNGQMSQAAKSKIKSKFFPLVAEAMALQWSSFILNDNIPISASLASLAHTPRRLASQH